MHIDQGALMALIILVCGVIYHAGRLSQRVDTLDKAVNDIPAAIAKGFGEIAALIRGDAP